MEYEDTRAARAAFDVEVRAAAESVRARPADSAPAPADVVLDAAAEAAFNAEAGFSAVHDAGASAAEARRGDYTPHYHPVSPFRLEFTLGSNGNYADVAMKDPKFLWSEADANGNPSVSMKTAGVGTLGLDGTMYLNVTLTGADGAKTFASAQVSMSSGGDISVPLYELDPAKGVVKDYRHAMVALGAGAGAGAPAPATPDPLPFEVRHDPGASESPYWMVYLPDDTSKMIMYDGEYVAAADISGIVSAQQPDTAWYDIANTSRHNANDIWLNITKSSGGTVSAAFALAKDTSATLSVLIAHVPIAGFPAPADIDSRVNQMVLGALVLAKGSNTVAADSIVGISLDQVPATGDDDSALHAHAIRLKRGRLSVVNGNLTVTADPSLSQFIDTTPISTSTLATLSTETSGS